MLEGNVSYKVDLAKILLTITYISNHNCITKYSNDEDYLKCLEVLSDIYASSKSLHNSDTMSLLLNGKKNNYFAYQFAYRNEYIIMFINFSEFTDSKFDLLDAKYTLAVNNLQNQIDNLPDSIPIIYNPASGWLFPPFPWNLHFDIPA
jgi:hypothetical protein